MRGNLVVFSPAKDMDGLVEMMQRAQAQGKLVDVTRMTDTGKGARLVPRPTKGNNVIEGVLLADTRDKIDHVLDLLNM